MWQMCRQSWHFADGPPRTSESSKGLSAELPRQRVSSLPWMVDVIKGFCVVYENNSDCLSLIQSSVPYAWHRQVHDSRNNPLWPRTVFVKLVSNCIKHPLANTFLIVGVNDIGLISCSTDFSGFIFGNATTFAFFQTVGITTSAIDELKIQANGSHKAMQSLARFVFTMTFT